MGNSNLQKIKILLASLVTTLAALADIYIIVNNPRNYILLGIISFVLIIAVYLIISGEMQLRNWEKLISEEQHSSMMISQKACYILVRKSFREISRKLVELDKKVGPLANAGEENYQKISGLLDELMQEQKKVAKFTVSRNKENANAMMNSNDKVIEEILGMQEAMNNVIQQLQDKEDGNQSEEFTKVKENQQELLLKIQQLEDSLKGQIELVVEKIQEMPIVGTEVLAERAPMPQAEPEIELEIEKAPEPEVEQEIEEAPAAPEVSNPNKPMSQEEIAALIAGSAEEPVPEEPAMEEVKVEEAPAAPIISDPNKVMSPEEIAALVAGSVEEPIPEEPVMEEVKVEEAPAAPVVSDPNKPMSPEEIAALVAGSVEEPIPEEPIVEKVEEAPAAPEVSDPNKPMSPEEIAALIAGNVEEPIPEKPIVEEIEEKPAMPEMSDPNKPMSPEEIAALIANM